MSWGLSMLVGLLTGALGAVCGGLASAQACAWHQVSTREGERATMTIYGGVIGLVIGGLVGIIVARTIAAEQSSLFMRALGWSAGSTIALSLVALGLAFASAPPRTQVESRADSKRRPTPRPAAEPEDDYGAQRMREVRKFTPSTPLQAWLGYTRGNEAAAVKDFALRAIAARPTLHADLCAMLDTSRCSEALVYILEEIPGAPDDLAQGVRAALRRVPESLQRSFRDSSGVHADSGLYDVRSALSAADRFSTPARSFATEVAEIARCFESAPRVRRISRGSRFVEEQIEEFEAERLLAAWKEKQR